MKLPRDVGGRELTVLLGKYGYQITRQTGSHIRLTSNIKSTQHHITIPSHKPLKVGTLSSIVSEVSQYLGINKQSLIDNLFG